MLRKIINKAMIFIAFSGIFVNSAFAADPLVPDAMPAGPSPTVVIRSITSNTGKWMALDIPNADAKDGAWLQMYERNFTPAQQWNLDVATDGSFRIRSSKNPSLCMGYDWTYRWTNVDWVQVLKLSYCDTSLAQKYYIQRTQKANYTETYVIRSIERTDRSFNIEGGAAYNGTHILNWPTSKPVANNETWQFEPADFSTSWGKLNEFLHNLADFRALQMHDSGSAEVPVVSYTATSPVTTALSANVPVSSAIRNNGSTAGIFEINWLDTLWNSFAFGVTQTTTVTLGTGKESPVNFSIAQAVGTSWLWTISNVTSTGGSYKMTIAPNTAGWLLRSHPVKTVKGKFTIYNNLGGSWATDPMTASVPNDSSGSIVPVLVACDSLSQAAVCLATKPAGV